MDNLATMGIISLIPATIAIIMAFVTRNTIFSLFTAIFIGVMLMGEGLLAFPKLIKTSIGTTNFAWILLLELFIGILIAFFQRTGAIQGFTEIMKDKKMSRKNIQLTAWVMGMFVFFSDYFSPLFVGSTMRSLSDDKLISREKLAYIADSTSAPVSVLVPITGWAVFTSGLLVGIGPVKTAEEGMAIFTKAVGFNFYAILAVVLVGLVASGIVPEFGPMKKAEKRAMEEGKVLRDGAVPLLGEELTDTPKYEGIKTHVFLDFILPVLIVITIAIGTYIAFKSAKTMEAFLTASVVLGIIMRIQGVPFNDIMDTAMKGMKGIMPAIIILALSYTINALSKEMGTANYIIMISENWLTPNLLPFLTFVLAALISFSTGTSWGTFAIVMPIAAPLAFAFSGNEVTMIVLATVAAVAGGGVFGDHCSPLSDTTILASTGAAADHIDHVKTQLPYALTAASFASVLYLIIGFMA
ncbi:Na+/H+ antiporter NhaC family protein [Clostridiaceae bacterium HSG29]|nr:Na+/H+ antiporter NhaC family protein [Clostridiaceae bacterium HSG29]